MNQPQHRKESLLVRAEQRLITAYILEVKIHYYCMKHKFIQLIVAWCLMASPNKHQPNLSATDTNTIQMDLINVLEKRRIMNLVELATKSVSQIWMLPEDDWSR